MTDDATIDEQVDAAWIAFLDSKKGCLPDMHSGDFRRIARDLLVGKFKEAPLPEIVPPPWPHILVELRGGKGTCQYDHVRAYGKDSWGDMMGPNGKTPRDAIEKWNAAFTRKDER